MSYTTPPTFAADTIVASDDLNILSGDIAYLKGKTDALTFSGVKVERTSSLSVATATDTPVTWQTHSAFDYGTYWASGTNVVIPAGAIPSGFTTCAFMCIAVIRWVSNATANRSIYLKLNGTQFSGSATSAVNGDTTFQQSTGFCIAAAGDIVTLEVRQNSGGALNVDVANLVVVRYAPAA